ncbi:MAG: DUF971 domain-containing protein [Chthoniobacterales bacterium]
MSPKSIQVIGNELGISWEDGSETYLPLEFLRKHCPCAGCGGEPDVLGERETPKLSYTDQSFQMLSWTPVGGYAIQPRWGDGHSTGIYSHSYLKNLAIAFEAS